MVRKDLSLSQQAVQACHAALESGRQFPWVGDHPHLVLLNVPDEPSLNRWLEEVLSQPQFKVTPFREPDLNNSLTAIAVAGVSSKSLRHYFRSLPLFKGERP